jgi:hypothetical protein
MIVKNKIKIAVFIISVVFILEILKYSLPFYIPFDLLTNEDRLMVMQLIFVLVGGGWALRLYYIANVQDKGNYLKTYVSIGIDGDFISIKTEVKNETSVDRKIYASFLIITKQGSDIVEEVNKNLNQSFKFTNNFSNLKFDKNKIDDDFAFIQLPYYYSENVKVGNEDLSFSLGSVFKNKINEQSQIYEVRFFVFRNPKDTNPYHRSVQTVFSSEIKLNKLFKNCCQNSNETIQQMNLNPLNSNKNEKK